MIVVPSKGRASLRGTIHTLLDAGLHPVVLVPPAERAAYARAFPDAAIRVGPAGLSRCHQHAVGMAPRKLILFDDDLKFATRTPDGLRPATPDQVGQMVDALYRSLDTYTHAGISERFMNHAKDPETTCCRVISVMAFRADTLRTLGVRMDRTVSKNDFDTTLQLLKLGHTNISLNTYTHDQLGGPTLPGGSTGTRTLDVHATASAQLHALHPDVVRVVVKDAKQWGTTRTDVAVQWRKALR